MANGNNKTGLLNFLAREQSENAIYAEKIKEHTLFVTHGDNCTKLSSSEADTRMLIPGCSSIQIMLLKMDISTLL